jgi:20S proteasome alpha/beta subunit
MRLLVAGMAGDCRRVVRFAKEVALNHTFEFDFPPSALQMASRIGDFLREGTLSGGSRVLASHAFVIDSRASERALFEISADGIYRRVRGGVAGRHRITGRTRLVSEANRLPNCTREEAMDSAAAIMQAMLAPSRMGPDAVDDTMAGKEVRRLAIPDEPSSSDHLEETEETDMEGESETAQKAALRIVTATTQEQQEGAESDDRKSGP